MSDDGLPFFNRIENERPLEFCQESLALCKEENTRLRKERDEARELVQRCEELAEPYTHPEQWIGYRHICRNAIKKWRRDR